MIEFNVKRCEVCENVGVAQEALGVELCSNCANVVKNEKMQASLVVKTALVNYIRERTTPKVP